MSVIIHYYSNRGADSNQWKDNLPKGDRKTCHFFNYLACSLFYIGWDETVQRNLAALSSISTESLWPRDTLFKYAVANNYIMGISTESVPLELLC